MKIFLFFLLLSSSLMAQEKSYLLVDRVNNNINPTKVNLILFSSNKYLKYSAQIYKYDESENQKIILVSAVLDIPNIEEYSYVLIAKNKEDVFIGEIKLLSENVNLIDNDILNKNNSYLLDIRNIIKEKQIRLNQIIKAKNSIIAGNDMNSFLNKIADIRIEINENEEQIEILDQENLRMNKILDLSKIENKPRNYENRIRNINKNLIQISNRINDADYNINQSADSETLEYEINLKKIEDTAFENEDSLYKEYIYLRNKRMNLENVFSTY